MAASRQLTRQWGDTGTLDANAFLTKLKTISARFVDGKRICSQTHSHTRTVHGTACGSSVRLHIEDNFFSVSAAAIVVVAFQLFYRKCTRFS